jgi:iron complex outermembrane receptor protein
MLKGTAIVNLPLGDRAALRIAGLRHVNDGYFHIVPGKQRSENTDVSVIRGQLLLRPTDNLDILLAADYSDDESDRGIAAKLDERMSLPVLGFGVTLPPGPRELRVNRPIDAHLTQGGASLTADWSLGGMKAKSITAWRQSHMDLLIDLDWTEVDFVTDDAHEDSDTITQELQLASDGEGRLEWIVGAFALREKASQEFDVGITPIGLRLDPVAANKTTAYGIFGQGTYSLTQRLRATLGLRYSNEEKSFVVERSRNRPAPPPELQLEHGTLSWSDWTPRYGLEYDVSDDIMVFASAAKGFKSGGSNTSSLAGPAETFDPETVWSYELGVKSYLWDRKLRFNATAFRYEYKDIQINARDPSTGVTMVFNGAAASGNGLEVDTTALLAPGFQVDVGVSLLDAKWDELITSDPDSADPSAFRNFAGNRLLRAPKLGLNLGAQYTFDAFGGSVTLNGGYRYQSKIYFNQFENILVGQPAYALLDARAEYRTDDGRLSLAVFGNNLTDKLYRTNVIRASGVYGSAQFWGPPRTYGVQMTYHY